MTVHFICTGNSFRSRLAEAYLNSKQLKNIKVISSGTATNKRNGPIGWPTERIFQNTDLTLFMSPISIQTTKELLDKGDLTIFMKQNHYDFAKSLGFLSQNYQIWDVEDLIFSDYDGENKDMKIINASEEIFKIIKGKVDELAQNLA